MDFPQQTLGSKSNSHDICLIDSGSTHTILRDRKYFVTLTMKNANVNTISGCSNIIEGFGKANIVLQRGTKFVIENALFSSKSLRNLLNFKDIRQNGYHIETVDIDNIEYLYITSIVEGDKCVLEKLPSFSSGLYYSNISTFETYTVINKESTSPNPFYIWHDRLGHPGSSMMRKIIENSFGHSLKTKEILQFKEFSCAACSQGKLITRPSPVKIVTESPLFLERIQGDICGPIHPPCGPFRYFMILIDASSRWSHVCLLSTRNLAFSRLLAQIIKLRAHFPDNVIKTIRLDNAGEFRSQSFINYCMAIGITVEEPVAHVHTQNGLAESFIKRLQLIARPLLMRTKLPVSAWGHAILHAAALVRIRPISCNKFSPFQLALGQEPNISHFKIFGCAVYVPIAPPQRTKMGPQRRLGIYVGFNSASIIKYLEPMTGDLFTARFADCHFDEAMFPTLGGESKKLVNDIVWNNSSLTHLDPPTKQRELEIQKIIHLQNIANQLPDAFTDPKRVTKSYIPAANAPIRIEVPKEHISANDSKPQLKRGRPIGSKDKNPRKRKGAYDQNAQNMEANKEPENVIVEEIPLEDKEPKKVENDEISMSFTTSGKIWDRKSIIVDNVFAYNIAVEITSLDDEMEPRSVEECKQRNDWKKWKEAIEVELNSLSKREVFGPIGKTPLGIKPVGYKWVFVRKRNENNEVVRYKARLVAQGFSQRPGIDYMETYSPVVDSITLRYLMSLAVHQSLDMRLMDVVTAYLYGSLDNEIYMKIPEGLKVPEEYRHSQDMCSIRLQKSLYGLKQSGRMWYNRLSQYLLKDGYKNDRICPCVFIKRFGSKFIIIAVYVDDLNIIGSLKEIMETSDYLKKEFEMKDLGKTKFCLGLQIEHLKNGIFIHQSAYTEKILKKFYMDKAHPLSTPMVVRSLDPKKDPFRPHENEEELLGPEVPYLSAIGALMYLANNTRPDISFSVSLLARFSSSPTRRHWNGVKHVFRYLQGSVDKGLFYANNSGHQLIGYADAGYLSDPHKCRSQTGYLFTSGGTAISWRSTKQTIAATSSNHSEIIAIHEASRECVWLRSITQHIQETCGLRSSKKTPTLVYEDNTACIEQLKQGYVKGDRTKHISPKLFYTHDLQQNGDIDVQQIRSTENLADLFTKALPTSSFEKLVYKIGMRRLREVK